LIRILMHILGKHGANPLGKIWDALASMIKLEDKIKSQSEVVKSQQMKIENLTERVIRLETQLEMLMRAAEIKRIPSCQN